MAVKGKPGLGKGLDKLIPNDLKNREPEGKLTLKLSQIEPNPDQPRKSFDKESIEELAESIKQYGVIQPIIVSRNGDMYEIIAGERRWRAARKAGLKEIPVVVKEYTDKEIAEISLIENIQREDLNAIEEALAYKQLIEDYKLTQEELSGRISKSRTAIANTMRLLKLAPEVQEMLIKGDITEGHARALLSVEKSEDQIRLAQKIIKDGMSVRQTEDMIRFFNLPAASVKAEIKNDAVYRDLEKKMTKLLGTKVRIRQKEKGKGKIEISYFSEDQLDELYTSINKIAK